MICLIIRKEILENLLSLRFILSLLLIILLLFVSGLVWGSKYRSQNEEYWRETNKNLTELSKHSKQLYELAFYKQNVWRKPNYLSFCTDGFEKYLPNCFKFDVFTMEYPQVENRGNFLVDRFADIDWVFIISIIFSFVAVLMTYNSICGEKETGTLRLVLAGVLPRYKFLLGKYFGAVLTLGIPLVIGLLVNLTIVTSAGVIEINAKGWGKILAVTILSFLYVSIFLLLGMLVSSRTFRASKSIVVLLFVWVSVVILIPGLGRLIGNTSYLLPTKAELSRKQNEALEEITEDVKSGKYGAKAGAFHLDPHNPSVDPPARAKFYNVFFEKLNAIFEKHHHQMINQALIGRHFTCFSPTVVYQRTCETLVGTGINHCINLYHQVKRYQSELKQFVSNVDKKDPNSIHLLYPVEYEVEQWGAISKKPVDFDAVPKFQERYPSFWESARIVIWDIGLLILFILLLFVASFVSFLKYDVR